MTISEVVGNIHELDESSVIYAEKINGHFMPSSEALVLNLYEEELDMPTEEISKNIAPDSLIYWRCN